LSEPPSSTVVILNTRLNLNIVVWIGFALSPYGGLEAYLESLVKFTVKIYNVHFGRLLWCSVVSQYVGTVENHENTEAVFSVFFVNCRVFRVF